VKTTGAEGKLGTLISWVYIAGTLFFFGDTPMLSTRRWVMRRSLGAALAVIFLVAFSFCQLQGREGKDAPKRGADVFIYPEKLTSKAKLTDGKEGKAIEIKSETTLIWVDLAPDAWFSHGTEYVLISAEGTRVIKGVWWPVLNGKDLFRDGKKTNVEFPIFLPRK
jgi:hypothetical protein